MTAYIPCNHIHGERWRSIDGYAKEYQVSQLGRVRYRMKGGKWYLFHPRLKKNGSYIVNLLRSDGTKREVKVRTLVMRAFVGERPAGMVAININGVNATYLIYRNGNPSKQSRGQAYLQNFYSVVAQLKYEQYAGTGMDENGNPTGGAEGLRFKNIYTS